MTYILRRFGITVFLFGLIIMFNRCMYVSVLIMGMEQKTTTDKWKSGKYKTRIQRRIGWAGPHYYHCRVKAKTLGGLFYRKIISETFSREHYITCIIKYPFRKDTIAVDICKKNTCPIK